MPARPALPPASDRWTGLLGGRIQVQRRVPSALLPPWHFLLVVSLACRSYSGPPTGPLNALQRGLSLL